MLDGLKSLLGSEKALAGGALIVCATVLVALGLMTTADWQGYTQNVFLIYVGGKTAQGVASVWASAKAAPIKADITTTSTTTATTDTKPESTNASR